MLQIIPFLLLFCGKYRNFVKVKYRPIWGFVFILPLIFVSVNTFLRLVAIYSVILIMDRLGFYQLNFLLFWLPVELDLIPANLSQGEFSGYFTTLVLLAHYLLKKDEAIDFSVKPTEWGTILKVFALLAIILIPAGIATGFLSVRVNTSISGILSFPLIFFVVAYPEELLFRAYLFRILRGRFSMFKTLLISSLIFGIAHLNGPEGGFLYFLFATIAGMGYGYVYLKTGRVSNSSYLHALIDYTWILFFGG